jgi:hypothetical protein
VQPAGSSTLAVAGEDTEGKASSPAHTARPLVGMSLSRYILVSAYVARRRVSVRCHPAHSNRPDQEG